jgi:magnesium chelatase family protein
MPKEGLHLDLPFALALLAALNSITNEDSEGARAIGELSLDGRVQPVVGTLPAALKAAESGKDLYCPETSGAEAEWVDATRVFATKSLMAIIQHLTGQAPREPHHTASVAAIVGGGKGACEISLQVFCDRSGKSLQMRIYDRS